MKRFAFFLIISFIATAAFSQSNYTQSQSGFTLGEATLDYINFENTDELNRKISFGDIGGSPFLNNEFISGEVYTTSKIQYDNVKLRYNIYTDQIEFESDGKVLAIAQPETTEKIVFGGYTIQYIPYSYSKKISKGYLILLEEGKASLYARPKVTFEEAEEAGAYKKAEPPKFVRISDTYFIKVGTGEATAITKKKDLEEVFPNNKDKIKTFIKKNKVKPNKEESLKELVNYYNSL